MTKNWTPVAFAYLAISLIGLIASWTLNSLAVAQARNLIADWFGGGPAVSSLGVDLFLAAIAGCILIIVEARRLGMKRGWLYVVLSAVTAFSFTFPLFLAMRERRLQERKVDGSPSVTGAAGAPRTRA